MASLVGANLNMHTYWEIDGMPTCHNLQIQLHAGCKIAKLQVGGFDTT